MEGDNAVGAAGLYRMILLSLCANFSPYMNPLSNVDCEFKSQLAYDLMTLRGRTINITTVDNMPMSGSYKNELGEEIGQGVSFTLFHEIQEKIGFKYRIIKPDVNEIGNITNGVIKLLHNEEVEMAVMFLPMLKEYRRLITFSQSLGEFDWVLFMRRPLASATGSGLLAPFEGNVWFATLASVLVVGPVTYILVVFRNRLCKEDDSNQTYSLSACIWFVYGALMKQGSTLSPMSDSARIIFATWWIFITILTSFYTANLTAFLTLSQFTLTIKGPSEIEQYKRNWLADFGGQTYELINNADELRTLKSMVPGLGKYTTKTEEILPAVRDGDAIYVSERRQATMMVLYDYNNKTEQAVPEADRCKYVLTRPFLAKPMAFAYPKNSTLQPLFNPLLGQLVQGGIVDFLLNKPLPMTTICPLNLASSERKLRNEDLKTTYYVVGAGFIVAVIVFVTEMILRKYRKSDPGASGLSINSGDIADHILGNGNKMGKAGLPSKVYIENYQKSPSAFLFQYTN